MGKSNIPGARARGILDRDNAVVSQSYPRAYPLVMDHGKDCEVWDVDGNRYIDLVSGIAVCSTGHSHPRVVEAIQKQAERFIHISADFYHPLWVEFAERLAGLAPFQEPARIFVGNSGTEAIEAAIKLSRVHSGRQQFIGFYGGFHGRTIGSLSFTASKSAYRQGFQPLMGGVTHVPFPDPYRPILQPTHPDYGETVVDYIENIVFKRLMAPEDCAAILVEPIQGEGGYVVPADGFFPALRHLCDRHGILLIVDEIQTGVGRTGKWWAVEHWNVEPDIVLTAKGIASGMPISAMIARQSVMDWPVGSHGNTFGGNPIACSAALVTLDLIENGLMQNAAEVGEYTLDALSEIQARHASIGDVRGKGLMIGVEFVADRINKTPAKSLRDRIVKAAFEKGILTMGSGESSVRMAPPLTITKGMIDEALVIFEEAIAEAEKESVV